MNWVENESLPHYLRDETEPYCLPIVVRVEKGSTYSEGDVFSAVSEGVIQMMDDPEWGGVLNLWMNGRIRKVVRRARGAAWERVLGSSHKLVKVGGVELVILPPHPLAEIPDEVRKLQVQGIDFNRLVFSDIPHPNNSLVIAVNDELGMSTGKAVAQVGHAVQIFVLNSSVEILKAWENNNFNVVFERWDMSPVTENMVIVEDAGFTEVKAGTVTVRAYWSGS